MRVAYALLLAVARGVRFSGELSATQWVPPTNASRIATDAAESSGFDYDELPDSWDWGAVAERSLLTATKNQNIPQYCGACYAFATITTLADRIKISRAANGLKHGSDVTLSVQAMLNCGKHTAGDCLRGSISGVYKWIIDRGDDGIPYETCQGYEAVADKACTAETRCKMCVLKGDAADDDADDAIKLEAAAARPAAAAAARPPSMLRRKRRRAGLQALIDLPNEWRRGMGS